MKSFRNPRLRLIEYKLSCPSLKRNEKVHNSVLFDGTFAWKYECTCRLLSCFSKREFKQNNSSQFVRETITIFSRVLIPIRILEGSLLQQFSIFISRKKNLCKKKYIFIFSKAPFQGTNFSPFCFFLYSFRLYDLHRKED
jgi:hypothetical protein